MKVDITAPLYYGKTGRRATIVATEPVVKHLVRFSNGNEDYFTQDQIDRHFTNEAPRFAFAASYANGRLTVQSSERSVKFRVIRTFGDSPGNDLNVDDVAALHESLGKWLADRPSL